MEAFDFSSLKTQEELIGNGVTRTFSFVDIPIISETDIEISIFNTSTNIETIIDQTNYTIEKANNYIGFNLTLDDSISIPSISDIVIAKLIRDLKNTAVFYTGSNLNPTEVSFGFQGLVSSIAASENKNKSISDIVKITDNYTLNKNDRVIEFYGDAGKIITFIKYNNILPNKTRIITVKNYTDNTVDIKYNDNIIDTAPAQTTCNYEVNFKGDYTVLI